MILSQQTGEVSHDGDDKTNGDVIPWPLFRVVAMDDPSSRYEAGSVEVGQSIVIKQ